MVKAITRRPRRTATKPRVALNESRAAGAPAPASAAASEPVSFYDTDANQHADHHEPEVERPAPQPRATFTETVRARSQPLERGGSVDREVAEHMAADAISDPDDLEAEIARIRTIRKPLGAFSQKLALPKRPGYHRHWFNDVAGRIEEAVNNGWSHVKGKDGKPMSRCVGTGRDKGALYAYAMEIPDVFWQEDQAARNQAASDKMAALKSNPFSSKPGQAKPADAGKFYSPTEALEITKG